MCDQLLGAKPRGVEVKDFTSGSWPDATKATGDTRNSQILQMTWPEMFD